MLSKVNRLKGKQKFDVVFKKGEKFYSPYFVMYTYSPSIASEKPANTQIGIVASKKVGGAVIRNRSRRMISELLRMNLSNLKPQTHYVFVLFKTMATVTREQLSEALQKLKLIK